MSIGGGGTPFQSNPYGSPANQQAGGQLSAGGVGQLGTVNAQPSQTMVGGNPAMGEAILGALLQGMVGGTQPMNDVQLQQLLRKLLGLPDNFLELLQWLTQAPGKGNSPTGQAPTAKTMHALMQQLLANMGTNLDQAKLQTLLGQQLGNANQQLGKLLAQQPAAGQQESLQQLASVLGQLGSQVQAEPMAALQTLMVLYLPIQPQAPLRAWFQPGSTNDGEHSQAAGGQNSDDALMLAVTVPTLGTFRITILLAGVTTGANTTPESIIHIGYPQAALPSLSTLQANLLSTLAASTNQPITPTWAALPVHSSIDPEHPNTIDDAPLAPRILTFPSQGLSVKAITLGFLVAKTLLSSE